MLAVLVQGGCPNAAKLASRQRRFEHVAGIDGAFGPAGAHNGVQFVDEQNDSSLAGGDFLEEGLEAVFKFAAVLGAGDHGAEVHRDELFVLQRFGHVAADDAPGQPLHDGGLAHAGLANQDGIVLGAPGQHLHNATDLLVAANDRIDLARAGESSQVAPIFFQGLEFVFRILVSNALVAAQLDERFKNSVPPEAIFLEDLL